MASNRRIGTTDSATRSHLLDVAEEMLLEEGYAAVTSRKLGARAEVSPQLVHYYFRTMDELFVEVFRRRAEQGLERAGQALAEDASLTAIWELTSNPLGARFNLEFAALANHRKAIRAEVAEFGDRFRRLQHDAVTARFEELGIPPEVCPPTVALLAMTGLAQIMSIESSFGLTTGHAEARRFVHDLLERIERGEVPVPG
ncbi:TetR/AcrR family transcriptional regulator [Dermatobacter hominis]|uniref:TetR/AcrR family transcriptional regulator n=1 Tax=Dermatobacter hominis TaxID=2884263 RepID=UPI001D10FB97|nr:TetR/AcrR family transcriptional regulator [Dermatobacter hominis]UDY36653.1 TetR/AcrR family transcriptional regulator [Dermatobacter hominis]